MGTRSARLCSGAVGLSSRTDRELATEQSRRTIAGSVKTADSAIAVPGRKVTVIDVKNGERHDTTTGTNGRYTIQVPEGTYRFEIELREGETLAKQPDQTHINNSDLDASRDFVITTRAGAGLKSLRYVSAEGLFSG
jgi:hypothetical protein